MNSNPKYIYKKTWAPALRVWQVIDLVRFLTDQENKYNVMDIGRDLVTVEGDRSAIAELVIFIKKLERPYNGTNEKH